MHKQTPFYILILCSICFFLGQERYGIAFPQGPAVNSGSNPIWSYSGDCTALSYTIPVGQDFIVTDLLKTGGSQSYASEIKADRQVFARLYNLQLLHSQNQKRIYLLTTNQNHQKDQQEFQIK